MTFSAFWPSSHTGLWDSDSLVVFFSVFWKRHQLLALLSCHHSHVHTPLPPVIASAVMSVLVTPHRDSTPPQIFNLDPTSCTETSPSASDYFRQHLVFTSWETERIWCQRMEYEAPSFTGSKSVHTHWPQTTETILSLSLTLVMSQGCWRHMGHKRKEPEEVIVS